jgi:hypothetical protein
LSGGFGFFAALGGFWRWSRGLEGLEGFFVFLPEAEKGIPRALAAPSVRVAGLGEEAKAALEICGRFDLAAFDRAGESVRDGESLPCCENSTGRGGAVKACAEVRLAGSFC